MNRKERRLSEKNLGLIKHYKTLSRSAKFDLQAERIILGKEREEEMKENVKQSLEEQNDERESKVIYNLAETISKIKKIPITEAMEEAKVEYSTHKK